MLISIILNGVVFIDYDIIGFNPTSIYKIVDPPFVGLWPEGILATGKRR